MFGWLRRITGGAQARGPDDEGIPLDLAAVPGAFAGDGYFPRPQWDVISAAAAQLHDRYEPNRVWCEVERQWLEALVEALGGPYRIVETKSVLLLTAQEAGPAASLARMCEGTLSTVHSILGEPPERCGKLPVFVFDSHDTYLTYVSYFHGEGDDERGLSGGSCIHETGGDVHVATFEVSHGLERTLAHEMVHARLTGRLPLWVEEGAAEVISRHVARDPPLMLDAANVRKQRHHWSKHRLDSFWAGASFQRSDRAQGLSYALAEVLMRNILSDHRDGLKAFLEDADASDAGEAAAQEHFGVSLGDLVAQFLGDGDWAPPPADPPSGDPPEGEDAAD